MWKVSQDICLFSWGSLTIILYFTVVMEPKQTNYLVVILVTMSVKPTDSRVGLSTIPLVSNNASMKAGLIS